jgi:hypothetical protein
MLYTRSKVGVSIGNPFFIQTKNELFKTKFYPSKKNGNLISCI